MHASRYLIRALATTFVSGPWNVDDLVTRGEQLLGRRWKWLRPVASSLVAAMPPGRRPSRHAVIDFLSGEPRLRRVRGKSGLRIASLAGPSSMEPANGRPRRWNVPPITTCGELAAWLEVPLGQLDWFADRYFLESKTPPGPLRHYRYAWLAKRRAGSARLLETPKSRLKWIQRRILHGILDRIPPHDAAHGFVIGRSVRTFVEPHRGQMMVLKLDLRDFFPSVRGHRLIEIFRTAGYPEEIAVRLSALCTNQAPDEVWTTFPAYGNLHDRWRHERLYCQPHLPQGAPTSPALANLASYRLDCRLSGLARTFGASYTRYADDLLFSGSRRFATRTDRFTEYVMAIALEERFEIHGQKTRRMPRHTRQQATGLVINERANLPREGFDQLKATLFNCVRRGPAPENREKIPHFRAHLEGRVRYWESINPSRGLKLRKLLDRIAWPEASVEGESVEGESVGEDSLGPA